MFGIALRKRIDEEKLANIFVNSLLEAVENGFEVVAEMINDDPAFENSPNISSNAYEQFLLIIITGNLEFLKNNTQIEDIKEMEEKIIYKYATIFGLENDEFDRLISQMKTFIAQINFPSKNYLYGISKAVFFKYHLNQYQESYFKSMNTPNPLFLKRMDEMVNNFLWDWDSFFKKHKLQ